MLNRKLWRELWRMRGQAATIILVVAAGIGGFIAMLSTYTSLQWSRESYYASHHFADIFADIKRAPETEAQRLAAIPGVVDIETAVVQDVTLDLPEVAQPVVGRMISLPTGRAPRLNQLFLQQGHGLEGRVTHEVLVSEAFAKAHALKPGDSLAALLNGKREELRIVGIVMSPEYIFSSRGGVLPDDKGFGVFWMAREQLASAFDMEGAFNHVAVRIAVDAVEQAVIEEMDRVLESYGALGAYGRSEQISHRILDQEINQQKTMSTVFPVIFLGVAAFLLNVVLSRQVATQRVEIAALKSLGYSAVTIVWHYLKLVMSIVVIGIVVGTALGAWLGLKMTAMYTEHFHFPQMLFRVEPWIILSAAAVSILSAFAGVLGTVGGIMRIAPAEAMRPPAPQHYRHRALELGGIKRFLPVSVRMIIRTMGRRLWRTFLTVFGVACAVAVIVSGTFWRDAIDYLIDVQFNSAERGDVDVVFTHALPQEVRHDLIRLPGVLAAEPVRTVAVRLRAGQYSYHTAIMGYAEGAQLRRLLDVDLHSIPLPAAGMLLSANLAQHLGVQAGDTIQAEILEDKRIKRDITVTGVVNDLIGLSAYMEIGSLNRFLGEGELASSYTMALDPAAAGQFYQRLKEMPMVATLSIKTSALESFQQTTAKTIFIFTTIITLFAATIAVGVVYNSARIALAERAWEFASLRVLGFTRREVSTLLLGELALELIVAIPLGLWLGYGLAAAILTMTHTDFINIPVVIYPRTYVYAALAVMAAGLVSALIVRHRIDHLDLVAVLKTRE